VNYFIDSNIFLRVLAKENQQIFDECFGLLSKIKSNTSNNCFYTGNLVVAEVAWTLSSYYKVDKKEVVRDLESILNIGNLKYIEAYDFRTGLNIYKNLNVKFIDALITSIPQIQSKEWTVISYDRDFDKLGVKRKEPMGVKEV